MKITSIDVIKTKKLKFGNQSCVFCRINTDEGIYGYGEAGVMIGDFALGSYELMKVLAPMLIGMDPLENDVIYEKLMGTFWAQGNGGVIMAAISAFDIALWDIKGKYLNLPCCMLLGGKHRNELRCYASQLQGGWKDPNFIRTPGDLGFLKDAIQKALSEGYTSIKIDFLGKRLDSTPIPGGAASVMRNLIPKDLLNDFVARVECARQTAGPDVDIIMENHNITNATTALQFARLAEPYDIYFLEEPASPLSPIEYSRLAQGTKIPLATGERSYTRMAFLPLIQNGSLSVIQPDITNCGGITECRKICDLANTFGVTVQTHTCNSPISVAAALHLEAAIPNFCIHEHHTTNTLPEVTEMCVYDYQPENGYFKIPDLPGLGNELSEKCLATSVIETIS